MTALTRRRPSRGLTVAIVGPDGAGKTTVARRLQPMLPVPATYLYMGVSAESSNHLLPTTRLVRFVRRRKGVVERGPRIPPPADTASERSAPERSAPERRAAGSRAAAKRLRAAARLANRVADESYRQGLASWHRRQGRVVLLDRHVFADYYLFDVAAPGPLPLSRRLHGLFVSRVLPPPDLLLYLDVPAELLFERKGEGTVAVLEALRHNYAQLAGVVPAFETIDGTRPVDDVAAEAAAQILRRLTAGGGDAGAEESAGGGDAGAEESAGGGDAGAEESAGTNDRVGEGGTGAAAGAEAGQVDRRVRTPHDEATR